MNNCPFDRIFYEVNGAYYSQRTPHDINMLWLQNRKLVEQNIRLNEFLLGLVKSKGINPVAPPFQPAELNRFQKVNIDEMSTETKFDCYVSAPPKRTLKNHRNENDTTWLLPTKPVKRYVKTIEMPKNFSNRFALFRDDDEDVMDSTPEDQGLHSTTIKPKQIIICR